MKIRLAADLQSDSIVDGEGIRTVIWAQGCPHHCKGCHNSETWDFDDGALIDITEIEEKIDNLKAQDGITFSGGDPMCQPEACSMIAKYAKKKNLNIWCYTGYTYEQLMILSKSNNNIMEFLKNIDVLVDGKFEIELKSDKALFRGSTNQRIIDVQKSLYNNEICLIDKYIIKDETEILNRDKYMYI